MGKKNKLLRKLLVGFLSVVILATSTGVQLPASQVEAASVSTIKNGTILHAFCWSFDTIKANMGDIAAAGYTAIQTSPINACESSQSGMTLYGNNGKWYYHYQPTDWTIGNYQLGTRDQFKAMCQEADKYGIQIIVDVVPNHTAPNTSHVSSKLVNAVGGNVNSLYHSTGFTECNDYNDRLKNTRYQIGGLPDVDTENAGFQNYFISYLNDCIACGADGFRYDTARHIGLPDDSRPSGVNNNFWQRVTTEITNASNIFNYGEVLQGSNERLAAYQNAIGATTASSYGATIRTALKNNNYSVSNIMNYQIESGASADKLVTWVESHDNYINDGTWSQLDETQIKLGWAIIAAREAGTPLFFDRPYGSSTSNQWGNNVIGAAGSNVYKSAEVAAVNKFRTAMVGQSEYLRNPGDNSKVLMIERGTKGVTIVNGNTSGYKLSSVTTNLANGTYTDKVSGNQFTVSSGKISGTVPARGVVVLYNDGSNNSGNSGNSGSTGSTTVYYYNSTNWSSVSAYVWGDSTAFGNWPGQAATNEGNGWWKITVPANPSSNLHIIFNDGGKGSQSSDFVISSSANVYTTGANGTIYSSKSAAETALGVSTSTTVYYYNSTNWSSVSAYVWGDSTAFGNWPGKAATNAGGGWWKIDVPAKPSSNLHIIFNDGGKGSQSSDFVISSSANVYTTGANGSTYSSQSAAESALGIVTVYYYNTTNWSNVSAYIWGDSTALGNWPGQAATNEGDGWWKITLPVKPSSNLHIIFNDGGKGSQSSDFVISSYTNVYTTGRNGTTYSSKEAAQ